MPLEYVNYIGPYIEINEIKKETHHIVTYCCVNDSCKSYKTPVTTEYCPHCGKPIKCLDDFYIEEVNVSELIKEDLYLKNNILLPNKLISDRQKYYHLNRQDPIVVDLSTVDISSEIDLLGEKFKELLDKLSKVCKLTIKWGLVVELS